MRKPDNLSMTFTKNDVEIIARETLYRGFSSLDPHQLRHRLFNGGVSGEVACEIPKRGYTAALLPPDPERDEVMLVEQIRTAVPDTSESPWLLETVTGMIEEGEIVRDAARRETIERTGLEVRRTKPVLSHLASSGGTNERLSILVGEVDITTVNEIHDLAGEDEDIHVHVISRRQAYQWVEEGKANNAVSVVVL